MGEVKNDILSSPNVLRPLNFLTNKGCKVALIILNNHVEELENLLPDLWNRSVYKACTDGGASLLYKVSKSKCTSFVPDILTGDFDSVDLFLRGYYEEKGCELIETPDQDHTDFTKCLKILIGRLDTDIDCIVVLGAFGGRFDHTMANINTLYLAREWTKRPIYLIAQGSLACLLQPGEHKLEVDTGYEDAWCGLLPIGTAAQHVITTGLKWNLSDQEMKFGTVVSTSNTYDGLGNGVVTVETDQPLVWTMGFLTTLANGIK